MQLREFLFVIDVIIYQEHIDKRPVYDVSSQYLRS